MVTGNPVVVIGNRFMRVSGRGRYAGANYADGDARYLGMDAAPNV